MLLTTADFTQAGEATPGRARTPLECETIPKDRPYDHDYSTDDLRMLMSTAIRLQAQQVVDDLFVALMSSGQGEESTGALEYAVEDSKEWLGLDELLTGSNNDSGNPRTPSP
jgi:hypothetical protein